MMLQIVSVQIFALKNCPTQDDMMNVHVQASESAMLHGAVQFADAVEVLSPASLRKQIAETLRNALKKYEI